MLNFESLILRFPISLIQALKDTPQSPQHHAEGSVFNHTKIVFNLLSKENNDLLISALFHDIGKIITVQANLKNNGRIAIQTIGHEYKAEEYIEKYKSLFMDMEIDWEKVKYICKEHMRMHKYLNGEITREGKIKEIESNKYFYDLKTFAIADAKGRIEGNGLPYFLILCAPPGCGKTTWRKNFMKSHYDWTLICPDEIRKEVTGDISNISQDKKVWALAYIRLLEALHKKENVIFDSTAISKKTRGELESQKDKAIILYKIFDNCFKEEAKSRIHKDIEEGKERSKVPDAVIDKMFDNFASTIQQIKESKFLILNEEKEKK